MRRRPDEIKLFRRFPRASTRRRCSPAMPQEQDMLDAG